MPVDPTGADLKRFLEAAPDQPVVMLNLLRFREGGRERYARYTREIVPFLEEVGGEVLYFGEGPTALVGQERDAVMVVRYPSRKAFSRMVADPDDQRTTPLRTAALSEAVLQATAPCSG